MNDFTFVYILLGLFLLLGILWGWYYLKTNVLNPSGKGAAERTARKLRKFALLRSFQVISNVQIDDTTPVLQNILIGHFGLLLVHTLGPRGEYYGTLEGENWTLTRNEGEYRATFENPILQQEHAIRSLRKLFSENNIYNVPIENIVVWADRSNKTGCFITNQGQIMPLSKLSGYLNKAKFEKDAGVAVQDIHALLQSKQD